ncbi:MAG TPA: hypothetical protein VHL53_08370, partial [Acidimicrobiia bacterium]|nr:hypothetical protein [Acidimicrobiia bacterium]
MATQRTSFSKLQRDRAKKAKAAAKRERRIERAAEARSGANVDESTESSAEGPISAAELLHEIEVTHQRFEAKLMTYDEFEEKKAE